MPASERPGSDRSRSHHESGRDLGCDHGVSTVGWAKRPKSTVSTAVVNDTEGLMTRMNADQLENVRSAEGFIAALDQSGGSTPKALRLYGVEESAYGNEDEMFDLIHEMRSRIITSSAFTGDKILGAILFEQTMDREIQGKGSAEYLWSERGVVPFLKVDKGLADESDDAQVMKPMPQLNELLARATDKGVFGTKMRSVIKLANPSGVATVVEQQFEVARQILAAGLVPIVEPEIDINSPEKAAAEGLLRDAIAGQLTSIGDGQAIMLKLTLPEEDNFYRPLIDDPRILRVAALSGGYSREEANARLGRNNGMIASFSRALTEGLSVDLADDEFDKALGESIDSIFAASRT